MTKEFILESSRNKQSFPLISYRYGKNRQSNPHLKFKNGLLQPPSLNVQLNFTQDFCPEAATYFTRNRVSAMKNKSLELDLRQIMQGLEEFATFMSYKSNYEGLRILKVETHHESDPHLNNDSQHSDNVISMDKARIKRTDYLDIVPVKNYQ